MSNKLHPGFTALYAIIVLLGVGLGFYLGQSSITSEELAKSDGEKKRSESLTPADSPTEINKIVELDSAREYNKEFKNFMRSNFSDIRNVMLLKEMLQYPIDIDNAKDDFKIILNQDGLAGLRMYPGLRKVDGKRQFTLIFIGTRADGTDLIYPKGTKIDGVSTVEETAVVQDQSRPCKPCTISTFMK